MLSLLSPHWERLLLGGLDILELAALEAKLDPCPLAAVDVQCSPFPQEAGQLLERSIHVLEGLTLSFCVVPQQHFAACSARDAPRRALGGGGGLLPLKAGLSPPLKY